MVSTGNDASKLNISDVTNTKSIPQCSSQATYEVPSEMLRFFTNSFPQSSWKLTFGTSLPSQSSMNNYSLRYPYHVYVHAPLFVTIRLNNVNFHIWEQILNLIESQGSLGFIDGTIIPSSPTMVVQATNSVEQAILNADFQGWM